MIEEVRRQFREIPGLREGREGVAPDSARCVAISTEASLKEMIVPGALAVVAPLVVGFISVDALGGLLAGARLREKGVDDIRLVEKAGVKVPDQLTDGDRAASCSRATARTRSAPTGDSA